MNARHPTTRKKTDPGAAPASHRTEASPTDPKEGTTMVTQVEPHFQPGGRRYLYRVPEAARLLSMSRSQVYELIRTDRLRTVKEGKTRLVPESAIHEYVALLIREATEEVPYDQTA